MQLSRGITVCQRFTAPVLLSDDLFELPSDDVAFALCWAQAPLTCVRWRRTSSRSVPTSRSPALNLLARAMAAIGAESGHPPDGRMDF